MKVSIITVCLNSASTIEQTINSVLNQSYKNIEYIIIDGASQDGTKEIIEKYRNRLAHYISEPDDGLYYAMNKGISNATGEIIGILNSDDYYMPDTVETVVNTFQKYGCQVVHGELKIIYGEKEYKIIKERPLSDLYTGMVIAHPTVFVEKSAYQEYGVFDTNYKCAADYEFMLRLYEHSASIVFLPKVLTCFRQGGYSQKNAKLTVEETYNIAQNYIMRGNKEGKDYLLRKARLNYIEMKKQFELEQAIQNLVVTDIHKILEITKTGRPIAIFGTGSYGKICCDLLKRLLIDFSIWVDNDISKQGSYFLGKPICSPERAANKQYGFIIASPNYEEEMIKQLIRLGVDKDRYITLYDMEEIIIEHGTEKYDDRKCTT